MNKRMTLRIIGFTTWVSRSSALLVAGIRNEQQRVTTEADESLKNYLFGQQDEVPVSAPAGALRLHDPVFLQQANGSWIQVGFVQEINRAAADSGSTFFICHFELALLSDRRQPTAVSFFTATVADWRM